MTTSPDSENPVESVTPELHPASFTSPAADTAVPAQSDTPVYAPPAMPTHPSIQTTSHHTSVGQVLPQYGQPGQPDHTAHTAQFENAAQYQQPAQHQQTAQHQHTS